MVGIVAAGFLIAFLMHRDENINLAVGYLGRHDLGVAFQMSFINSVVAGLYRLLLQSPPSISRWALNIGPVSCFSLRPAVSVPHTAQNRFGRTLLITAGCHGPSLIWVSCRLSTIFLRSMIRSGVVVALVSRFVACSSSDTKRIFVSSLMLKIPAASIEEAQAVPWTRANDFLHYFIWIGSYMGVYPLPFWTIWLGSVLLRKREIMMTTKS